MIVSIGVREYRLRLGLLQHFFKAGIEKTRRKAKPLFELSNQLPIGLSDSHNLQVFPLLKLVEESEGMSMREPRNRHAQRLFFLRRRVRLSAGTGARTRQRQCDHQEKGRKAISSHTPPCGGF